MKLFAKKLKKLVEEMNPDQHDQIFFAGVDVKCDAEIDEIKQTASSSGSSDQKAIIGSIFRGNVKIRKVTQD
jgi:hypothetical protein